MTSRIALPTRPALGRPVVTIGQPIRASERQTAVTASQKTSGPGRPRGVMVHPRIKASRCSALPGLLLLLLLTALGAIASPCPPSAPAQGSASAPIAQSLRQPVGSSLIYITLEHRVLNNAVLELTLRTNNPGWLAVGISETGHMLGSDIAVVNINDTSSTAQVLDYHVYWTASPLLDTTGNPVQPQPTPQLDKQQDWSLTCSSQSPSVLQPGFSDYAYTIVRNLVTTDVAQDRPITNQPQYVIFAWSGDGSNTLAFHSNATRGTTQINFLSSDSVFSVPSDVTDHIDVFMTNVNVSNTLVTQYLCQGFDLGNVSKSVVAFEPLVLGYPGQPFAHHALVHLCGNDMTQFPVSLHNTTNPPQSCQSSGTSSEGISVLMQQACTSVLYEWAIGGQPFATPVNVGFHIGPDTRYVIVEFHVTNPNLIQNQPFTAGMRLHTAPPRLYNATMVQFGDPATLAFDQNTSVPLVTSFKSLEDALLNSAPRYIPPGLPARQYEGSCPSGCTSSVFTGPTQAFRSLLHMHQVGRTIFLTRIRNNTVTVLDFVQYWNFGFQNSHNVSFDLQPGDAFNVHCVMDTTRQTAPGVAWGFSSFNEMCMAFVLVWPRENVASYARCGSILAPGRVPYDSSFGILSGQLVSASICAEKGIAISTSDGLAALPSQLAVFGPPATSPSLASGIHLGFSCLAFALMVGVGGLV